MPAFGQFEEQAVFLAAGARASQSGTSARGAANSCPAGLCRLPTAMLAADGLPFDAEWLETAGHGALRGRGRPVGTGFFGRNQDVADAVEVIVASRPVSAPVILELLSCSFPPEKVPSLPQLHRFIRDLEGRKAQLLMAVRNPDAYKARSRLALGRADADAIHAHAVWEIDTTKADVMTSDAGRVIVLGIIDRFSRRARFKVVPSESGQSVRRFLAETMVAWDAVPLALATDNGSGFINSSVTSALAMLDIDHLLCDPGSPEQKPFVERMFGTATRGRLRLLKGFTGHNVAEAAALRSAAKKRTGRAVIETGITAAELQEILSNWVEGRYNQRSHSGTGQAPLVRMLASRAHLGWGRPVPDSETLRIATTALVGQALVGKRGVQWKRGRYWCDALVPHMGRTVIVRRDEDELGELLIFDAAGHFIGTAVNYRRAGVSEAEFATAARQAQARWMAEQKAELRAKAKNFNIDDAVLRLRRDDAVRAGKVAELRPVSVPAPDATPTLASIASHTPVPARQPDWQAIAADRQARHQPAQPTSINRADLAAEADALIAAHLRGEEVPADRLRWAQAYVQSPNYRSAKQLAAIFNR